jgi:hypothetical protein
MPTYIDGQQNAAAITNPGVYVAIVPPKPNLVGSPTNKVGLVGVSSWGAVGGLISISNSNDAAVKIGTPQIRTYDMSSYIEAATQVGGRAIFNCIRVTDGTDTAATASIQSGCLTLTGACTGSQGNLIRFTMATGTALGSFMASILFPGATPEIFNNIGNGLGSIATTPGTGYTKVPTVTPAFTFAAANNPNNIAPVVQAALGVISGTVVAGGTSGFVVNDLITLSNGVILKVATVATGVIATVTVQAAGSLVAGNVPTNPVAMVSQSGVGVGVPTFTLVWGLIAPTITQPGSGLSSSVTLTLTNGGAGTGGTYVASLSPWLNLANAINNGNNTRAKSKYVIATAGTATTAPVLGSPVTLTGGTDGAAGVSDTSLVGNDVFPRTGMYALRSTGISAFGLCDLSTSTLWPAMDVFALSETCVNCVSTFSGDTVAGAAAARVAVGLDDMWTWICVGDYPTFYDAQNKVSRLISPVAFQVGYIGNSSPEQSPLNKVIRGISGTQRQATGQPYSDAENAVIQTSGIDVIVGPPTTPGGDYYSFISGRNASSNTSANGIEWTTLTNFLARTAQTKAAGSVIGQLQSIQPNDPTRANAKALFDGFSAQLANPVSGSNGLGIIDTWSVVCDLSNNTPDSQSRGYLFLFWEVRYLNTVRYFVVKLAGGGNVSVTQQETIPSVSQLLQ